MKRLFIIIATALFTLGILTSSFIPTYAVQAQSIYLRIITEDTPFYKNTTDQSPLFYLPYTYYVKLLGKEMGFYHVEIYGEGGLCALDGFVPDSYLYDDGLYVDNPYVILNLTTTGTAVLYADSNLTSPLQYLFPERQLTYYGQIKKDNSFVYYVCYNDRLGYIKEANVFPFSIPNHPNELTFIKTEEPPPPIEELPPQANLNNYNGLKIAIIACLIFAGIIALVFALRAKPNKSVAVSYYDENDYE